MASTTTPTASLFGLPHATIGITASFLTKKELAQLRLVNKAFEPILSGQVKAILRDRRDVCLLNLNALPHQVWKQFLFAAPQLVFDSSFVPRELPSGAFVLRGENVYFVNPERPEGLVRFSTTNRPQRDTGPSRPTNLLLPGSSVISCFTVNQDETILFTAEKTQIAAWGLSPTNGISSLYDLPLQNAPDCKVCRLVISPNGKRLFSGNTDGTVIAWDLSVIPPSPLSIPATSTQLTSLFTSVDGDSLFCSHRNRLGPANTTVWTLEDNRPVKTHEFSTNIAPAPFATVPGGILSISSLSEGMAVIRLPTAAGKPPAHVCSLRPRFVRHTCYNLRSAHTQQLNERGDQLFASIDTRGDRSGIHRSPYCLVAYKIMRQLPKERLALFTSLVSQQDNLGVQAFLDYLPQEVYKKIRTIFLLQTRPLSNSEADRFLEFLSSAQKIAAITFYTSLLPSDEERAL